MKLKKELVDELISTTKMYYSTGEPDNLRELVEVENEIKEKYTWMPWDIFNLIEVIEDLAKFIYYSERGTNEDIYKVLEVFGVIVE